MHRKLVLSLVILAAGCGGGGAAPASTGAVPVASTATEVVESFMRAVADSNVVRMGQFWGTSRGPAAATGQPADWQQRLTITQLWLRGGTYRISSNVGVNENRRELTLDLERGGCVNQVPFTVTRSGAGGWLVVNVDVSRAGNPARPCGDD